MNRTHVLFVFMVCIAEVLSQRFILPTYRPPIKRPVIRKIRNIDQTEQLSHIEDVKQTTTTEDESMPTFDDLKLSPNKRLARNADRSEPQWLLKGDDIPKAPTTGDLPYLPKYIDDIRLNPNRRYARSVQSDEPQWLYTGDDIPKAPASGDHPYLPKYIDDIRLNPNRRYARSVQNDEPQWLYKGDDIPKAPATGDHPYLPKYIDDIRLNPNRRYARSYSSDSARKFWSPLPTMPRPKNPFNPVPGPTIPRRPFPIYA